MSSILRALNKLEKNPQEKTAFNPWQRKADARRTSGRGLRGMLLSRSTFYIFLAAPFLLIGGWLLLKYGPTLIKTYLPGKPLPQPVETRTTFTPKAVKTQSKPAAKQPATALSEFRKGKAKTRKAIIASRSRISVSGERTKNAPSGVRKTRVRAQSKPLARRPRTAPAKAPDTRIPSRRMPPIARKDQRLNPQPVKTRSSAEAENPIIVKSKGESDFEVQAIAWSYTPEKRIAVINSKVVHEGDSVDGATVSKIDMDDVSIVVGNTTLLIKCGR